MTMAAYVLHAGSVVHCAHGGLCSIQGSARVRVMGMPVARASESSIVSACPLPMGVPGPCLQVRWGGGSQRVMVEGMPAVLSTTAGVAGPTDMPVLVVHTQGRVRAL